MQTYFPKLYGNRAIATRLGHAIANNNFPHAVMIEGKSGSGKKTLAIQLAAALNCTQKEGAVLPCGECPSCRKILSGQSPDVIVTSRGDRATIGVEQIRAIREDMHLSATEAAYKVYIIDEASTMTAEAQNALLISLEEPPRNVCIFLLTETTDTILVTVKSRVRPVRMQCFRQDELAAYARSNLPVAAALEKESPDSFALALTVANGCIGALIDTLEKKALTALEKNRATTDTLIHALLYEKSFSSLHEAFSALPQKRPDFLQQLLLLTRAMRDLLAVKQAPDAPLLYYASKKRAEADAEQISLRTLVSYSDIFTTAAQDCAKNGNIALITATLLSGLRSCR